MTSRRWQDLYQANQDTIRRSRAKAAAAPVTPAGRWAGPISPADLSPPNRQRLAGTSNASPDRVYSGPEGSRPYRLYLPRDRTGPLPLIMLLHGCTQDADAIAAGTRMNALADAEGFAVVYPEQIPAANSNGCWNWFLPEHQGRDAGEPAILAGITREVLTAAGIGIDASRVYVAGMSAGAGMAAVLAVTHPDLIAAVGVHSGLAFQSATSMPNALTAMRRGGPDPAASAAAALATMGRHARPVPAVIMHGSADRTVAPVNGEQALRQWLETNRLAEPGSFRPDPDRPSRQRAVRVPGRYPAVVRSWDDGSRPVVQHWQVEGLGHAWSGGSVAGSFTDPKGPDATTAMWQFFRGQHRPA